jgi:hypothetical protein
LGKHRTFNLIDLERCAASGFSNGRRLLAGDESGKFRKQYPSAKKYQTQALDLQGERRDLIEEDENLVSSSTPPNIINEENK